MNNLNNLVEREYVSKKGNLWLDSSLFGKCRIIDAKQVKEELEGNECFYRCTSYNNSKFRYYVDEETIEYFAERK